MKMEKIKTFEDACKALKLKTDLPDVSLLPEKHREAITAHYKLVIIAEALNDGWEPNWNDSNEWKYYAWFEVEADKKNPSGFGFSTTDFGVSFARTGVGSRLCFRTRELALYAAKQFKDLYKQYFLILK